MKDDKFLLILLVLLGFISFLILKPFLTFISFSILLTIVAYPLYEKGKSRLKFAPLSAILLIVMIILIIIVPSLYITVTTFSQAAAIITNIGAIDFSNLQKLENTIEDYLGLDLNFAESLRVGILDLSSTVRFFILENIVTFTRAIVNFVIGVILTFFIMFYLFIGGKHLVEQVKRAFPIEDKYKDYLFNRAYKTIQGLFLGIFLTAMLQGVLAGIGYWIFGLPNVIFLSVLTGVVALVPILAPPIVYVPASIYLLSQGNLFGALGLLLYGTLLISTIDNFIRPLVVRFKANVHPLYVILGIIGGAALFGFSGIIIGPLILALFQEVFEVYQLSKKKR